MHVYILQSEVTNRFYVGIADDLTDRLQRHNQGRSKATKHGVPWKIIAHFKAENRSDAMILERKIKKQGAERFLERLKNNDAAG